jgi:hypothetical protein
MAKSKSREIFSVNTVVCYGITGGELSSEDRRAHITVDKYEPVLDKPAQALITTSRDATVSVFCPYLSGDLCCAAPQPSCGTQAEGLLKYPDCPYKK